MKTATKSCPACGSAECRVFYELSGVPVHSVLLMRTREEAISYPRGQIRLALCGKCGFIFNSAFDPALMEYCSRYEETQGYSETFRAFHRNLAGMLDRKYGLRGKTVIEIGCGKGEFLTLLCETTGARGIGFDPSYIDERNTSPAKHSIEFIRDFYGEKYSHYSGDLICCKMTLEHIHDVRRFVDMVSASVANSPKAVVFFQVPDVTRVLRDAAFWDIYFEHCSYFSPGSLARLFRRCGLEPFDVHCDYDGQYLMIEARRAAEPSDGTLPGEETAGAIERLVREFERAVARGRGEWRDFLGSAAVRGEKTVLWGGGSKAVAFLTTLGLEGEVRYAVDINPHKQGTYLPGCGRRIVSPEFLKEYRPDNVILMNGVYQAEVSAQLAAMRLSPRLMSCDSVGALHTGAGV